MATNPPTGAYCKALADSIRAHHLPLLEKGRRRSRYDDLTLAPITQEVLAACAKIDPAEFSKLLRGVGSIHNETLFRLIAMPWVSQDTGLRWMLLWMANESSKYQMPKADESHFLLDKHSWAGWDPLRNLERLADSFGMLARYTRTLGVITQLDHARSQIRRTTKNDAYCLPDEGPRIPIVDFGEVATNSAAQTPRDWQRQQPLTSLTVEFARKMAETEAEERISELNGYLNDDFAGSVDVPADDVDRDTVLSNLGVEVQDRIEAAAIADLIIVLARTKPDSA